MSGPLVRSFYELPPDLASPDGGIEVRLTDPPGFLSRTRTPVLDASMARFIVQDADALLGQTTSEPAVLIHDFSSVRSYELTARQLLTDWGRTLGPRLRSAYVHIDSGAPRLVHMGLSVATAALTVLRIDMHAAPDLEETLRTLGVRPRRT